MTLAEIERAWSKPALDLTPATQGGFLIELATVRFGQFWSDGGQCGWVRDLLG